MLIVNQGSEVSTVIENQVEMLAILEGKELLFQAPIVFFFGLSLPRKASASQYEAPNSWGVTYTGTPAAAIAAAAWSLFRVSRY